VECGRCFAGIVRVLRAGLRDYREGGERSEQSEAKGKT
jgi:hypothetical protein